MPLGVLKVREGGKSTPSHFIFVFLFFKNKIENIYFLRGVIFHLEGGVILPEYT